MLAGFQVSDDNLGVGGIKYVSLDGAEEWR